MNATLRYLLPLSFVFETRLDHLRAVGATAAMEWLPAVLVIGWFADLPIWQVPAAFAVAWTAFMSIYEIGYLLNDLVAVRFEDDPRRRTDAEPTALSWPIWIGTRLATFAAIGWYFGWFALPHWWVLFVVLVPVYLAHNLYRSYAPKVVTFVGLATIRFLAPIAPFLAPAELSLILFPAFLNYVLYRTLSYLDSKELLAMPSRTSFAFRLQFYAWLLAPTAIAAAVEGSWVPLAFTAYYLTFWLAALAGSTLLDHGSGRSPTHGGVGGPAEGS